MPVLKVKTLDSREEFTSDDGKFIRRELVVEVDGKKAKAKTYSNAISEVGFEGDVEAYQKDGSIFLKQLRQDSRFSQNNKRPFSKSYDKPSYTRDDDMIKAQWAINAAIAVGEKDLDSIEVTARELFAMAGRVKTWTPDNKPDDSESKKEEGNDIAKEVNELFSSNGM